MDFEYLWEELELEGVDTDRLLELVRLGQTEKARAIISQVWDKEEDILCIINGVKASSQRKFELVACSIDEIRKDLLTQSAAVYVCNVFGNVETAPFVNVGTQESPDIRLIFRHTVLELEHVSQIWKTVYLD